MRNNAHEGIWRGARLLAASALATVIMASGNAALATGDSTYGISGNSTFSDCGAEGSDFALLFTGSLKGCLSIFVQGYSCKEVNGFAHYTERGREYFVGKWRGQKGRFSTDYKVDAAYAQGFCESFDYSLELSGSCIHKIHGQSGVFANSEGVYTMFDVITGVTGDPVTGTFAAGSGGNNFLYVGRIMTSETSGPTAFEDAAPLEFRSSSTAAVAARKASSRRSC